MSQGYSLPDRSTVAVRPATVGDAPALVRLMFSAIDWGHFQALGHRFATLLHRHMISSPYSCCWVAERNGAVIGYVACSIDNARFYRSFLLRHGFAAAVMLLPKVLQPRAVRVIVRSLTYFPKGHAADPKAEILSFAVAGDTKKAGVGKAIFTALSEELRQRGVPALKIGTVATTNDAANAFYQRMGCELVRTEPFYRHSSVNVYVCRLA